MPKYTVLARTRASAVFYPGKALAVPCHTALGAVTLIFRTTYKAGFDAPLPVDFYVEAVGEAPSILEAEVHFVAAAEELANVIAFVTNAHLGQLELELAYDCSQDLTKHEFMQRFVPVPPTIVVPGRPIDPDIVAKFLDILDAHPDKERLQRAIAQYVEALRRWNVGHEIMCVAHLYMGVEALTKALLRAEMNALNTDEGGLAAAWGIDITKADTDKLDLNKLDGEVRRRSIFRGDNECFAAVKRVSDGFEHGFAKYADMHQPARETVSKTAGYLRAAITNLIAPSQIMDVILTDDSWDKPRGPIKPTRKLRGTLVGPADALQMEGNPYPILIWNSSLKTVRIEDNGRYGFAPAEKITPQLGKGIRLELGTFEFWDDAVMSSSVPATATPVQMEVSHSERHWRSKFHAFAHGLKHLVRELFS